jgi:NADH dehydrogenase [ubiquinone] 1 alpha subcomplex assembly factor 5
MPQELIFDRDLLIKRRASCVGSLHKADFLIKRSLEDIVERLNEMTRDFQYILNLGARNSYGTDYLKNRSGTKQVVETDISFPLLSTSNHLTKLVCDEEYLPFIDNQFDLIVSVLNLHNVNDLPGCLIQLRRILKPKGLLIISMFGEYNLANVSEMLIRAEMEACNGISPRISPCVDIKQLGGLLQRAGFAMPVVDKDSIDVHYSSPIDLLHDLQNMGESNIMLSRNKNYPSKKLWQSFAKNGEIVAKFEILNLTASKD